MFTQYDRRIMLSEGMLFQIYIAESARIKKPAYKQFVEMFKE